MDAASSALPSILPVPRSSARAIAPGALARPIPRASATVALAILALNLVDAFATLRHLAHGAEEINPFMAWLLEAGPVAFVAGKHFLASAGVIGILAQGDVRPARWVLRYLLLPVYVLVAIYQVLLFVLL